jgi:hypothetical protein
MPQVEGCSPLFLCSKTEVNRVSMAGEWSTYGRRVEWGSWIRTCGRWSTRRQLRCFRIMEIFFCLNLYVIKKKKKKKKKNRLESFWVIVPGGTAETFTDHACARVRCVT